MNIKWPLTTYFREKLTFYFEVNLKDTYLLVFTLVISSFFPLSREASKWTVTNSFLLPLEPSWDSNIFPLWKERYLLTLFLSHCESTLASFSLSRIVYLWIVSVQAWHFEYTVFRNLFFQFQEMCSVPRNQTTKSLSASLVNEPFYFPN